MGVAILVTLDRGRSDADPGRPQVPIQLDVPVGIASRDDTRRSFGRVETVIAKVKQSASARSGDAATSSALRLDHQPFRRFQWNQRRHAIGAQLGECRLEGWAVSANSPNRAAREQAEPRRD